MALSRARESANGRAHILAFVRIYALNSPDFADCPTRRKADDDAFAVRHRAWEDEALRILQNELFIFHDAKNCLIAFVYGERAVIIADIFFYFFNAQNIFSCNYYSLRFHYFKIFCTRDNNDIQRLQSYLVRGKRLNCTRRLPLHRLQLHL